LTPAPAASPESSAVQLVVQKYGGTSVATMLLLVSIAMMTAARFTGRGIAATGRAIATASSRMPIK